MKFNLHPDLKKETFVITELEGIYLLLKDDARFPWFILVPKGSQILEMDELSLEMQERLFSQIMLFSKLLKQIYQPDKLNIASLGNIVPQLHIHMIARYKTDRAWPGPVWGFEKPIAYSAQKAQETVSRIQQALPSFFPTLG